MPCVDRVVKDYPHVGDCFSMRSTQSKDIAFTKTTPMSGTVSNANLNQYFICVVLHVSVEPVFLLLMCRSRC